MRNVFHSTLLTREEELSALMALFEIILESAIGDTVAIKKIKAPPAEKVVVAPLEAIPPIDERYLADALESVPVTKGDNIMIPYFGGRLTFQVLGVSPMADAVLITQRTIFAISEKGETLRGVPQVTYRRYWWTERRNPKSPGNDRASAETSGNF